MANLARPEATAIDDVFGVDGAVRGRDVPRAVSALRGGGYRRVCEILCAVMPGGLGERVGGAGGVEITILIVPEGSEVVFRIDERMLVCNLLWRDEFLLQPHIAGLGALALQIVVPGLVGGEIKAAGQVQPDRLAGKLFDFPIQIDRVALQP